MNPTAHLYPPYVPEINEFYARAMHFDYRKLRVEPERMGIVINASDHSSFLYALAVPVLVERLFEIAGLHPALKPELARKAFVVRTLARMGLNVGPLRSVGRPLHGGTGVTYDDPESRRAFGAEIDGKGGG